jgi:hypothetical protein
MLAPMSDWLTSTPTRIAIMVLALACQAYGAAKIIQEARRSQRVDARFREGIAEAERLRREQAERVGLANRPTRESLAGAAQAYRESQRSLKASVRRHGVVNALETVTAYGAHNFGEVLPQSTETVLGYLSEKTQEPKSMRWVPITQVWFGVIVGAIGVGLSFVAGLLGLFG